MRTLWVEPADNVAQLILFGVSWFKGGEILLDGREAIFLELLCEIPNLMVALGSSVIPISLLNQLC